MCIYILTIFFIFFLFFFITDKKGNSVGDLVANTAIAKVSIMFQIYIY
jgi:hypothetical protein